MAGHQRLSNLCWIYDSNRVTIEGHTDIAFTEDVAARFLAYGWNVDAGTIRTISISLERSYRTFLNGKDRPTLIVVHSHIGYGAPHRQDSPSAHGEPLGAEEVRLTKEFFGFDPSPRPSWFLKVCGHILMPTSGQGAASCARHGTRSLPAIGLSILIWAIRSIASTSVMLPDGWDAGLPTFPPSVTGMSTRDASSKILNAVAEKVHGWSVARLTLPQAPRPVWPLNLPADFRPMADLATYRGRNFHFGVREHAMCAAVNGMTLERHAGLRIRIFDLHRLCAGRDPPRVAHGSARSPHMDA